MINIGKYMRYSTDSQELKVQDDEIDKYIQYTFREEHKIFEYKDEGYSGKNMDRRGMEALKNDILSNKINVIVALKLDRLGRSLQDLLLTFDFFKEQGVKVHLVKEKVDTSTSTGKLMFQILGSFAEFERETIVERLKAGKEYAKQYGTRSGKPMNRPRKEINITECINLYKKGVSLNKIAKIFKVHPATIKSRLVERNVIR